jgi:hypothetical protein
MSEINNTKNVRDDEIDLLDLFRRMGRSIINLSKALGRGFLITVIFLFRRWVPLGISVVLGSGISFLFKISSESLYTSDLVLRTNSVPASDLISYLNRLHTFCQGNNKQSLADAISLNLSQSNNIIDISAFWIIDKGKDGVPDYVDYNNSHDVYDTVNVRMDDRLDLRARIKSTQELVSLRNGILKFINSDSLFQQRNRVRLRQSSDLLTRLEYDILQLDSLQKFKYFEETKNRLPISGGQMVFLQEQKTQLVYTDKYKLYEQKQSIESQRELYKDIVTVLSEFTEPVKRDNGALFYARSIVPVFFFITLLILIMLANRNKLAEIYKKY